MSLDVHKVLYLYKTPSKFYIQPVEHPSEALIIDRQTCEITVNNMFYVGLLPSNITSCLIYGIIGAIDTGPIYRMDQAQVIPFNQNSIPPKNVEHDWNSTYVSMLESVLQVPSFYFSYSYDLTNSSQRIESIQRTKSELKDSRNYYYYDKRFLWNNHLISTFDQCGDFADRYKLPLILGFVRINKIELGYGCNWTLVSRRGVERAGTRFNSRGIDHNGNVSNFVETEQIFEEPGISRGSFVQVRGSIPLIWKQTPGYKYKPVIEIDPTQDQDLVMKKHFEDLTRNYGSVSVVNLIDHKGHEGNLEYQFSQRISAIQKHYNIPYHYFDFHKECSKMRWHRLSILLERIQSEIESYGYFAVNRGGVIQLQNGVIRSNCIDSLDRTNVVQSMIAQKVLETQLVKFKLAPPDARLEEYALFLSIFKNTWADNADALSIQYAGTPALKTDFTRTGQRTQIGLVKDGINSLTRYVSNNYLDQYRQDAIDLFLGHYEGYPSPLYKPMNLTSYTSPLPVTVVVLTFIVLFIYLRY